MIKPTIGRIVLVRNRTGAVQNQDEPAIVCFVSSDTQINVCGFDAEGWPFALTGLYLYQGDDDTAPKDLHAAWMPYQKAQARNS